MGCNCGSKARASTSAAPVPGGTYRVMVNGRQVYETTNGTAAGTVAARFTSATVLAPGETA